MAGQEGGDAWQDSLVPVPRKAADHITRATYPHLLLATIPASHVTLLPAGTSPYVIHLPASFLIR